MMNNEVKFTSLSLSFPFFLPQLSSSCVAHELFTSSLARHKGKYFSSIEAVVAARNNKTHETQLIAWLGPKRIFGKEPPAPPTSPELWVALMKKYNTQPVHWIFTGAQRSSKNRSLALLPNLFLPRGRISPQIHGTLSPVSSLLKCSFAWLTGGRGGEGESGEPKTNMADRWRNGQKKKI